MRDFEFIDTKVQREIGNLSSKFKEISWYINHPNLLLPHQSPRTNNPSTFILACLNNSPEEFPFGELTRKKLPLFKLHRVECSVWF